MAPAFVWLAPPTRWSWLVGVLVALAVVSYFHDVPLPGGLRFDAVLAVSLIAVVLAGPLAALFVGLAQLVVAAALGRERLWREGNLANLAAFGWEALVAAWVLRLLSGSVGAPVVAILAAGVALALTSMAVGPSIYATLWVGRSAREVAGMLAGTLPAAGVMLALGSFTAALVPSLGVGALVIFAAIAVVPQGALTVVAGVRSVADLDGSTACERYSHALALQLGLSRVERAHLRAVAAAARRYPASGDPLGYVRVTLRDCSPEVVHAQLVTEFWNGDGGPTGLRYEAIPVASRILAVAQTWSALTARDTAQLSHEDALVELQRAAGGQLDPRIVRAAHAVVAEERVTEDERAPEPRMHRFRVPARLRRALATA